MVLQPSAASLDGRVAVVTGGKAGISAPSRFFSPDRDTSAEPGEGQRDAASEKAAAQAGGLACVTDVRDADQVAAALTRTIETLGVPTILVNNAGGTFVSALLDTSPGGWEALIRANLTQVLLCTQRVARAMVGAGRDGSIINISTIEAIRAAPGYAAYAAAKAGVVNFTKTAALELAPHGIGVNGLAPDLTATEGLLAMAGAGLEQQAASMIPLGRVGHVDEMAGAAVFLAFDLSSYVTGVPTSPGRPCPSTAAPRPAAAGTAIPATVITSSARTR